MVYSEVTDIFAFKSENIFLSEPKTSEVPVKHTRVNVLTKYPSGKSGPLIFTTESCFSFGIQESQLTPSQPPNGYSVSICMFSMEGKTPYEEQFVVTLESAVAQIKKLLVSDDMRVALNRPDLEESDLKKLKAIWYKRDGLKFDKNKATMYPKLICNRDLKIYTTVTDQHNNEINPLTLLGQKFTGQFAIRIESIYFGQNISLQIKVADIIVNESGQRDRKLLTRTPVPFVEEKVELAPPKPASPTLPVENKIEVSEDEEEEEQEEEEPVPVPVIPRGKPPVVRRGGARKN